jgi:hypothetical protein
MIVERRIEFRKSELPFKKDETRRGRGRGLTGPGSA